MYKNKKNMNGTLNCPLEYNRRSNLEYNGNKTFWTCVQRHVQPKGKAKDLKLQDYERCKSQKGNMK